jgi:hypothetical protein
LTIGFFFSNFFSPIEMIAAALEEGKKADVIISYTKALV